MNEPCQHLPNPVIWEFGSIVITVSLRSCPYCGAPAPWKSVQPTTEDLREHPATQSSGNEVEPSSGNSESRNDEKHEGENEEDQGEHVLLSHIVARTSLKLPISPAVTSETP